MNMPFRPDTITVRALDRADPDELVRIDAYVMAHELGRPFHRPSWIMAVAQACGHEWRYLIAEDGKGEIVGLLPLNPIHSALFGRALVSSGFAVGGGILSRSNDVTAMLADASWDFAQKHSFPSVELRGGVLPGNGWQQKDGVYAGFVAELAEDDESQLLAIPRKQRAEIRKGLKNDLEVRIGRAAADREMHYAVYAESVRNLGTPVFPKTLFDHVLDAFGNDTDILTVLDKGTPVSSVLSLYHHDTVMPYWGGGVWDARRLKANEVMYYSLMNHGRERGCKRLDFGRSKLGTGPYNFKKNWGFEPEPLTYAMRTADGGQARDVNPLSAKYKLQVVLWQRLPLSIANRLGPVIAKGLG